MLSRHLRLGLPLFLWPAMIPSRHNLESPVVDLLMCTKSFTDLLFNSRIKDLDSFKAPKV